MTTQSLDKDGGKERGARPGLIVRLWRFVSRPTARYSLGLLVLIGAVGGVLFWGGLNWGMELTNRQEFCVSCHEMGDNVFVEYSGSVHDSNKSGVRASCPDCHVPKDWVHKVARKIQASGELYHHLIGSIKTREDFEDNRLRLATNVWRTMKTTDSRECRNCHNFQSMDVSLQNPRARASHLAATGRGETCIDCHKGIAHQLPAGAFEAERKLNEALAKGH